MPPGKKEHLGRAGVTKKVKIAAQLALSEDENISSDQCEILILRGKTEQIACRAWNSFKEKAKANQLSGIVDHCKVDQIKNEAMELLSEHHKRDLLIREYSKME